MAIKLLAMPYSIGNNPETGLEIKVGIGRYGPYLLHNKKYVSIKMEQLFTITIEEATSLIKQKTKDNTVLGQYNNKDIYLCKGRYGPYLKYDGENIALPKDIKTKDKITHEDAIQVIKSKASPK